MVYFLLPAYNEQEGVWGQLDSIKNQMDNKKYKFVVVNDGSTDGTLRELERYKQTTNSQVLVINHPKNLGTGRSFKDGFNELLKYLDDEDVIITMDFDNTQSVETVPMMIDKIREGYHVVNASAFAPEGGVTGLSFIRLALSYLCNMLYKIFCYIKGIHDYTGFYKAFSGYSIKKLHEHFGQDIIESRGFTVMAEVLIKCRLLQLPISEVPMFVHYEKKMGKSKLRIFPTISEHLRLLLKYGLKFKKYRNFKF